MNFLLAIVLLFFIGLFNGVSLDNTNVINSEIKGLNDNSKIIAIDNHFVNNYDKLALELTIVGDKEFVMSVKENGKVVKIIKNVRFGKNGVCSAEEMIEGGKRTPFGTYKLGISFGTHNIDIDYPYIKINDNCYWVDDSNSPYYNCLVSKDKIDEYCSFEEVLVKIHKW